MAITAQPYGTFYTDLASGVHNFATDTDKVALLTSSYTPDYDSHDAFDDVSSFQLGTAQTITQAALAFDASTDKTTLTAQPVTWTGLNGTFRYAVVYRNSTTAANSKLIGLIDFGENRAYSNEDFQLTFPSGVLTIGRAA